MHKAAFKKNLLEYFRRISLVNQEIGRMSCLHLAAGMAYSSLFAMVPAVVVLLSVISAIKFFPAELKKQIEFLIFENFIPETSQKLSATIARSVQGFADSAGAIGFIGSLFMLLTVFLLLNNIEATFNNIVGVNRKRHFFRKIVAYTFIVVWAPFLIGLSLIIKTRMPETLPILGGIGFFYRYFLAVVAFTFSYRIIPNVDVSYKSALTGAVSATIFWHFAHRLFTEFIVEIVEYDKIYGALGAIPLFLVWLYLFWVVVLAGMVITALSARSWCGFRKFSQNKNSESIALKIMLTVRDEFRKSRKGITLKQMAAKTIYNAEDLRAVLDVLVEQDLLTYNAKGKYSLLGAPENYRISDIIMPFTHLLRYNEKNEMLLLPFNKVLPEEFFTDNLGNINKMPGAGVEPARH